MAMLGQMVLYHSPSGEDQAALVVKDHGDGTLNLVAFGTTGMATFHAGAILGAFEFHESVAEGQGEGYWTVLPPPPMPPVS